jgi:hypothetical protein
VELCVAQSILSSVEKSTSYISMIVSGFRTPRRNLLELSQSCKTTYDHCPDDESYLGDGMPLPAPSSA